MPVPLKLVPGNAADIAEFWVLTEEAVDQLDAFVRDADERLDVALVVRRGQCEWADDNRPEDAALEAIAAGAAARQGAWIQAVLEAAQPVLAGRQAAHADACPRRGAQLLADDPAQIVWLMPQADGKFIPEVLPDDAFRPLADWIDYVIDHEHEKISAWINATRFDFAAFICRDDQPEPSDRRPTSRGKAARASATICSTSRTGRFGPAKGATKKPAATDATDLQVAAEVVPPSELKVRLREVEEQFKNFDGPLDDPAAALWPQLARLNAGLKDKSEAAICWTNAFWEEHEHSSASTWDWLHSEDAEARQVPSAVEWDAALAVKMPSPEAIRGFAAGWFTHAGCSRCRRRS